VSGESTIEKPLPLEHQQPGNSSRGSYKWIVLIVACAGWIFDIYENQIFIVTRGSMLGELLHQPATSPAVKYWGDAINSGFLVGGALGGILFGWIGDRFGRSLSMIFSILVFATFSALTALSHTVWHVAVLRFLVAVGTGGEWAVAAALVSEVFPQRIRAHASGIFHASSVIGLYLATQAGRFADTSGHTWRAVYLLGLGPAVLVFVVRFCIREPTKRSTAGAPSVETGPAQPQPEPHEATRFSELWHNKKYRRSATFGLLLAGVGLAGYWAVASAGQDLASYFLSHHGLTKAAADAKAKEAYGVYQNIGSAIGLFSMGPLCSLLGRKRAFVLMQLGAVIATPILCFGPATYGQFLLLLAVMAFFVTGMHAGYAVFFPELFPTRLRATGAGLCFNGGRLVAAPMLTLSAAIKARMDLRLAVSILGLVYAFGILFVLLMPETKGQPLEE
jgi:MFS family permease